MGIIFHIMMGSIPPAIIFCNGDITYPATPPPYPPDLDVFIGSEPTNPSSYIASASELTTLQTQLFIDDTMSKAEFDARIAAEPAYPVIVRLRGLRILVILPTFQDEVNKHCADVVVFLKTGLAYVERNRFWDHWDDDFHSDCNECQGQEPDHHYEHGFRVEYEHHDEYQCDDDGYRPHRIHVRHPFKFPNQAYDMQRITAYSLLRAADSHCVAQLPWDCGPRCGECNYPFYCDKCHTFSGIKTCRGCECDCLCGCALFDNQGVRYSGIHLPNCDNEYHNPAFIHRK